MLETMEVPDTKDRLRCLRFLLEVPSRITALIDQVRRLASM